MNDLKSIRDEVIKKGFLELLDEDIQIEYTSLEDALFEYGELSEEGYYIEVDESLKNASQKVIEGGLAHELSHIVIDRDLGDISVETPSEKMFRRYKTLDERNTDLTVILRGFGSQLLALLKYSENKGFSHYREDGLSIREVEQILSLSDTR
ncbi:MAG: hypothetical protein U9N35_08025 [Euryarchaeota archaeon]|nr:hypothetical protein [Euryarchaeota archaeon]